MNILKLIFRYLTDVKFRKHMNSLVAVMENKNGIADELSDHLIRIKQETLARLKKRVDTLSGAIDHVRGVPGTSLLVKPLNDLLNELKEDYKEIESMQ